MKRIAFLLPSLATLATLTTGCPGQDPPPVDPVTEEPATCERTSECPVDAICDVSQQQCVADLICVEHADCGVDAYCDDGQCRRSTTGVACDTDDHCYPGDSCFAGHCGCAGASLAADPVAPNVLVVLDRSGSMNDSGGDASKWDLATAAVDTLVADYGDDIRFGLVLYSGDDRCGAGEVDVAVGANTDAAITAAMEATSPDGSTPIGATLNALLDYRDLQDPERDSYIVLLTDGRERCDGDAATAAAAHAAAGVRTFVIGFGAGVDADALDAIAEAGDTDAGTNRRYIQADDGAALEDAFGDIASSVVGCSFELPPAPADASQLFVYVGDAEVPEDGPTGGWTYDTGRERLTLTGAACAAVRSGTAAVSFARGCPPYVD